MILLSIIQAEKGKKAFYNEVLTSPSICFTLKNKYFKQAIFKDFYHEP